MTTTSGQVSRTDAFSQQLRELSWPEHSRVETAGILRDLFTGRLDLARYAGLLIQLAAIYDALEDVGETLRDDPVAGPFVSPALARRDALAADLTALAVHGPADPPGLLPCTVAYAARIRETATWPGGFVAHHYTRYLGDLSGGQAMGAAAARAFGLTPDDGLAFFTFTRIEDPAAFKDAYRRELDDAPFDADERARVGAEVLAAYAHNAAVLDELGSYRP